MQTNQKERTPDLIHDQRKAADIVTDVLLELKKLTVPDVSLGMLDALAEKMIVERGGEPYNKGYKPDWAPEPYPATICASVDFEICHAPPQDRELKEGQIVTYDIGVRYGKGCGDAAITVPVGHIRNREQRLLRYALRALNEGIKTVKAGVPLSAISKAVERVANENGYRIIEQFGGHHIGYEMHEEPHIHHTYKEEDDKILMKEGDVLCIEPLMTPGKGIMSMWKDGWTAFCTDRQPVAMFEHMILVTKDGHEILTKHL